MHVPAGYTKCICGHAEDETLEHFKTCPLYRGLDTLTDGNPIHIIAQHAGWPTWSSSPSRNRPRYSRRYTGVFSPLPSTHPRGQPPGHGSANATDSCCQNSLTTHIPHAQIPALRSHRTSGRPTSSNSCSTNRQTPPSDLLPTAGPSPSPRTIVHAQHRHDTHEHHRHGTHTHQHARNHKPPCPHTTVCPKVPPTAGNRVPPLCAPTATMDGPTLQPRPLGLPRSRTPLQPLPPMWGPQPPLPHAARSLTPPPASHPSFFGPLTDTLRDYLGGHYVADPADHAWTIAMATGDAPLPLHSPPLRHRGGSLNVAAHNMASTSRTHSSRSPKQQLRCRERGR